MKRSPIGFPWSVFSFQHFSISAFLAHALPLLAAGLLLAVATPLRADVSVPALFSNHAVLQAAEKVPVWGKADPGEAVAVTLGKAKAATKADAAGKWRVDLDLRSVGNGPLELSVAGKNKLAIPDVLVGQVWVCSGQSNMEWPLRNTAGSAEEIARSANPQLRQFIVEKSATAAPSDEVKGHWTVAAADTAADFTAVGYYFGQYLQHKLGVPVGLINSSWGGTPVEAWTSAEGLDTDADLKAGKEKAQGDAATFENFIAAYRAWQEKSDRLDRPAPKPTEFNPVTGDASGWKTIKLPDLFAASGLADAGAVWISRKITLPASAVGGGLDLFLGDIRDAVKVYWDGNLVGEGGIDSTMHRYGVNAKFVTSTEGVLSIRIFNPSGGLGIAPGKERFRLGFKGGSLPLDGEWMAKTEYAFPALAAGAEPCPAKPPLPRPSHHVAGRLFNGMIHPIIPYAIAGVIWYQGEQNWDRGWQYRIAFPLMISDWRKQWGQGDFPFYFCQLANYQARLATPSQSFWAEVRESQSKALALPQTGQTVLIDVGDANNIHPADKRSPGERLAFLALAKTYGQPNPESPACASWKVEGDKVRVEFGHAEGGLVAKPISGAPNRPGSELQGFAICGADKAWKWADAKIEGSAVIVSNPDVPSPIAVRYAWADNPLCNLFNAAGLPASPFRTDDFPAGSEKAVY